MRWLCSVCVSSLADEDVMLCAVWLPLPGVGWCRPAAFCMLVVWLLPSLRGGSSEPGTLQRVSSRVSCSTATHSYCNKASDPLI